MCDGKAWQFVTIIILWLAMLLFSLYVILKSKVITNGICIQEFIQMILQSLKFSILFQLFQRKDLYKCIWLLCLFVDNGGKINSDQYYKRKKSE